MSSLRSALSRAFFTGLVVLLPLVILGMFFRWLFRLITDLIQPFTNLATALTGLPELLSDVIVVLIILLLVLLVGSLAATTVGLYFKRTFEAALQRAPGYQMIREIVNQLFGDKKNSPLASGTVCRARIHGSQSEVTATGLVTSRHEDGTLTVFIPTGPNPTTGFIYHLPPALVELHPEIKADAALRTIIACGAGSARLFAQSSTPKVTAPRIDDVPEAS